MLEPKVPEAVLQSLYNFVSNRRHPYYDALDFIAAYEDGRDSRPSSQWPKYDDPGAIYNICCHIRSGSTMLVKPPCTPWEHILIDLRWSGDHWYFMRYGMYCGVEMDGEIHT